MGDAPSEQVCIQTIWSAVSRLKIVRQGLLVVLVSVFVWRIKNKSIATGCHLVWMPFDQSARVALVVPQVGVSSRLPQSINCILTFRWCAERLGVQNWNTGTTYVHVYLGGTWLFWNFSMAVCTQSILAVQQQQGLFLLGIHSWMVMIIRSSIPAIRLGLVKGETEMSRSPFRCPTLIPASNIRKNVRLGKADFFPLATCTRM